MTLLRKRIFFNLCIFMLLLLNTFVGGYISAEFQSTMYIVLIVIVSFAMVYLIVKKPKKLDRQERKTEEKELYNSIAKKILEKKNKG